MSLSYLLKKGNGLSWSDTEKSARIRRNLGEPVKKEFGKDDPSEESAVNIARWSTSSAWNANLPKGTEHTFLIEELNLNADPPYFVVQYVEARR